MKKINILYSSKTGAKKMLMSYKLRHKLAN